MESPNPTIPKYCAANYCISFIDLLGQRDALRGQGLLPIIRSEADDSAFQNILRDTVGPILRLQHDVDTIVNAAVANPDSPLRTSLTEEERAVYDEMQLKRVKTQYWSDGFIRFVCLGDQAIKCPLTGITEVFQFAGYFCCWASPSAIPFEGRSTLLGELSFLLADCTVQSSQIHMRSRVKWPNIPE
jgi:hypothetical protein